MVLMKGEHCIGVVWCCELGPVGAWVPLRVYCRGVSLAIIGNLSPPPVRPGVKLPRYYLQEPCHFAAMPLSTNPYTTGTVELWHPPPLMWHIVRYIDGAQMVFVGPSSKK